MAALRATPTDQPLQGGVQITDKLELISPIGEGGTATVWRAQNLALECEVAVKFLSLRPEDCPPEVLERFKLESMVAAQVQSPYVVRTLDKGIHKGLPFIVMELVEGLALDDWMQLHPVRQYRAASTIVDHVARALKSVHRLQLVHRDIKPANVMVCDSGDDLFAKLLDFGVAKDLIPKGRELTADGVVVGTPYYMSPEQIMSSKDVDARADLWALGVLAYELLFGALPFDGDGLGDVFTAVTLRQFRKPSDMVPAMPQAMDAFFERVFSEHLDDRFETAKELSHAFRRALAPLITDEDEESWEALTTGRALASAPVASPSGSRIAPPRDRRTPEADTSHVRSVGTTGSGAPPSEDETPTSDLDVSSALDESTALTIPAPAFATPPPATTDEPLGTLARLSREEQPSMKLSIAVLVAAWAIVGILATIALVL